MVYEACKKSELNQAENVILHGMTDRLLQTSPMWEAAGVTM